MDGRTGYITISVDDGHPTDLRTADLLEALDLRATFYIPASNPERPVMSNEEIRRVAGRFEVGGHTMHHRPLTGTGAEASQREIVDGKAWLEDIAEGPVRSFCYPQGKFNARLARQVEAAGFDCGRTCMLNLTERPANPYTWGVSTQAASHSRQIQVRHAAIERNWAGLANYRASSAARSTGKITSPAPPRTSRATAGSRTCSSTAGRSIGTTAGTSCGDSSRMFVTAIRWCR